MVVGTASKEEHMPCTQLLRAAGRATGAAAGLGLGAVFGAVAALRHGRPLHPQGATLRVTLLMEGVGEGSGRTGVPLLDDAGVSEGTVRVSRAMGLPPWLPDIYGVALRLPQTTGHDGEPADLLFASTGDSRLGRFTLLLHSDLSDGPLTTLLPVRSPAGPLLLRLEPVPGSVVREVGPSLRVPDRLSLSYAVGAGPWVPVAEVAVGARIEDQDDPRRHDPIVHQLPGTEQYPVVRFLREPSYAAARHQKVPGEETRERGATEANSTR
jgi:hypothetical protein